MTPRCQYESYTQSKIGVENCYILGDLASNFVLPKVAQVYETSN